MEDTDNDETPSLEEFITESETSDWKPSPETQEQILGVLDGVIPTNMRPSELMLEKYYDRGHQLYKAGRYKAAMSYFKVLTNIKPQNAKYLMATGACHHMLKEYSAAMDYYTFAAIMDDQNPIPQYHLAGCMIKMEQPIGALVALTLGIERCNLPRYNSMRDRMKMMMDRLDRELKEKQAAGIPFIAPETENATENPTGTEKQA